MVRTLAHIAHVWIVVAVLAVAGVVSAGHMAPDRHDPVRIRAALVTGSDNALCGVAHEEHEHRCPFCHKLPAPPEIAAPDAARRLGWALSDSRAAHLVHGPQHFGPHVSVRGPPARA